MLTIQHNHSAAKLIRQYEQKERGYSAAAKELQRRFAHLDWGQQKRIITAFLQGTATLRKWIYTRLLDLWDDSFAELVQKVWEQYHEEHCSWVIIRHFPWEYVKEQMHQLIYFDGNYRFICKRFSEQVAAGYGEITGAQLSDKSLLYSEGASAFWSAVRLSCSVVFPTAEDGTPIVNPSVVLKRRLRHSMGAPSPRDITEIENTFYPVYESDDMVLLAILSDWCDRIKETVSQDSDFKSYHISITDTTNYNRVVYLILIKHMKMFFDKEQENGYYLMAQPLEPTSGYTIEQLDQLIGYYLYGNELSWDSWTKSEVGKVKFIMNHQVTTELSPDMVLPTGMKALDVELRGGLLKGTLNLLAGRPMMGTTAMAYSIICNVAAENGIPTALYTTERTLEMAKDRLRFTELAYMNEDEVGVDKIPDAIKKLECIGFRRQPTYREHEQRLLSAPLWIEHGSVGVSMNELEGFIERQVEENHVQLVVVDRVDQLSLDGCDSHEQAMRLAAIAEKRDIVILACCGVSRDVENRVCNKPCVGDVQGIEALEVYANTIMLLYRPEYYGIQEADYGSTHKVMQVTLGKNNQGPSGFEIRLHFEDYARVCDWMETDVVQFLKDYEKNASNGKYYTQQP